MKRSLNILETLPYDYWNLAKDKHLFSSNHTFFTQKQLFHQVFVKKYFPLKWSLNVPWMFGTLQRWKNTQPIFPEYYVSAGYILGFTLTDLISMVPRYALLYLLTMSSNLSIDTFWYWSYIFINFILWGSNKSDSFSFTIYWTHSYCIFFSNHDFIDLL